MQIDPTMSLGRIAAEHPQTIRTLERLGLDYCCGGNARLEDAAEARGLSLRQVLADLASDEGRSGNADEPDWTSATMSDLADHIEATHHAFVRRCIARLEELWPRVVATHGQAHPELHELREVVAAFADDMRDHMIREERVVFPWLRRLERRTEIQGGPPWSIRRPISCMIHDHDDAAEALSRIRDLTSAHTPPDDACPSFRELYSTLEALERDTHVHIHKENNILFPAGVEAEAARDSHVP